ncbi:DUF6311 domain-containing protein [Pseudorhizobium flavum]|uniref:DUF6311 domain-containing protein n=1 Tax=Pseudorhizobium flavum TaxID=1335061 RepID=A0A7W9Z1Z5_9HYPH|nr:DUF6311 domain-containing protein [Pseudorhizobium flavum]MBB6182574.1 hypothetical protein [Pseudorhizobium flavum]
MMGATSFIAFFGLDRALGTDPVYQWPAGDQAQHIAGAFAYLDGEWSFPLFGTDRINVPEGVNIIFTDSAPFAGLVAKLFQSLTGIRFNYLGSWFAVLWVGQAAGGAFLARQWGFRDPLIIASAAVFALAWPAFLNRHFHLALGSHFLLLFALGLYMKTVYPPKRTSTAVGWALLLGVAIWTHAYLFFMSFALFAAAYADLLLQRRESKATIAVTVGFVSVWCSALALAGGYQSAGDINALGYGSFPLDLLAYIWPHGSALLEAPVIFSMQSAFEGFNYLGLGGIICVVTGLFLVRKHHLGAFSDHPLFVLCVIGMLAFAITNNVTLAGRQLLHFDLPVDGFPFSTFRASGRFGWIFGYVIGFGFFALVIQLLCQRSRRLAVAAAVMIAALQAYDAHLLLRGMQNGWTSEPKVALEAAVLQSSFVRFWPPIDCLPEGPSKTAAIEALAIVARAGKPTDGAHIARGVAVDCSSSPQLAPQGVLTVSPAVSPGGEPSCNSDGLLRFCRTSR